LAISHAYDNCFRLCGYVRGLETEAHSHSSIEKEEEEEEDDFHNDGIWQGPEGIRSHSSVSDNELPMRVFPASTSCAIVWKEQWGG
jgi:hypothetical protein